MQWRSCTSFIPYTHISFPIPLYGFDRYSYLVLIKSIEKKLFYLIVLFLHSCKANIVVF